ncbi:BRCA1-associated RING domain protein 1 [Bombina bombina]|uniref:BRCA1-associated RING domain protein 1 n=1 Tax=Bombina bombina TaxID=8345 RepID=UPI00235AAAE4|nr:BRCA1-associated RING domain protein 1 [Bombina bombina]
MPLRVRSGNEPKETMKQIAVWSRTRAALGELETELRCSGCSSLLNKPVCLGGCEHVFCRMCVGESIGSECPLCHTPAWVQDVQINRQLENMIQLCSKLRNLLDKDKSSENKMDLCQDISQKLNSTQESECKKKQIKMWFSPRSGKMRCVLEKGAKNKQPASNTGMSSYDFVSSSPNEEPVKKKVFSKPKKTNKKQLDEINQEWGIGKQEQSISDAKVGSATKNNRSVSFSSPPADLQSPETLQESGPTCIQTVEKDKDQHLCVLVGAIEKHSEIVKNVTSQSEKIQKTASEGQMKAIKKTSKKCKGHQPLSSAVSKRPRKLRNSVTDSSSTEENASSFSVIQSSRKSLQSCECPVVGKETNKRTEVALSRSNSLCSPVSSNKSGTAAGQNTTFLQTSPSNPNTKRNHRGETMLHLASIKGDLQAVDELLKGGANPNVKDHAGWTPLHEACNHGHSKLFELLLQHQALVNTAGYQNDTPLHDAAKNGHTAIVQLLLSPWSITDAVNIFGLRPVDYAETEEIKSVLLKTQTNKEALLQQPCSLSQCQRREGTVVMIASGLSGSHRSDLSKLAAILKAELCTEYNSAVTHVIVGEESALRTMKCMMGTLAGCWILRFSWAKACLQSHEREAEEPYEIPNGPHKARLHREQLLPRLFDGCHFYFLGFFKEHRKEDLAELVKAAGGQILIRQPKPDSDVTQTINTVAYHAEADSDQRFCTQYIIYDKASKYQPGKVRQGKVWVAPSSWLIECIICFQLLPVEQ